MKIFYIDHIKNPQGGHFNGSYSNEKCNIIPWTESKFIINLEIKHPSMSARSRHFTNEHLQEFNLTRKQFYLVDNEMSPILTKWDQVPDYNPREKSIAIRKSQDGNLCFFHGFDQISLPLFPGNDGKATECVLAESGGYYHKKGKRALISGTYQPTYTIRDFLKSIFVPVEITGDQLIQLDFHSDTSYTYKVMEITCKYGEILNVCVSNDELKGCALVSYHNRPWEVVIFDLE